MATLSKKRGKKLKTILLPLGMLITIISVVLWVIKLQFPQQDHVSNSKEMSTQQVLPDLPLTRIDGTEIHLSSIHAKILMITFWATWCDACMMEMPSIVKLREAFREQGFEVLGVNLDENPEVVVPHAIERYHIQFPVFRDMNGKVAEIFDVRAIPLTIIMDNQRKVLRIVNGEQNWNTPSVHQQLALWLTQ